MTKKELAESYYIVASDIARQAEYMSETSRVLYELADKLSEAAAQEASKGQSDEAQ